MIGGGKTKREKERVREDTMLREGMDIKCKQKCVKKKRSVFLNIQQVLVQSALI